MGWRISPKPRPPVTPLTPSTRLPLTPMSLRTDPADPSCPLLAHSPPDKWIGRTLEKVDAPNDDITWWTNGLLHGPCWKEGNARHLKVRRVNYARDGKALASDSLAFGSMYTCISCDAIRSSAKLVEIVGKLVEISDLSLPAYD